MPKRRLLGCSFPLAITLIIILLAMLVIGFLAGPVGKSMFGGINLPEWLSVSQPSPELPAEVVFHILGFAVTNSIVATWITIIVLVGISYAVTRRMEIVPGRAQMAIEFILGWLYDFCRSAAGDENGRRFFPLVTTIFLFVIINAWLALVPGYGSITINTHEGVAHLIRPANTDINTPLAVAFVSVGLTFFYGFKSLGVKYAKKFVNVSNLGRGTALIFRGKIGAGASTLLTGIIEAFVGFLEFVSELIHVVSFTFRLFGNMTAGEILLLVAIFLVPWLFAVLFYGLELLIGFLQALIFAGLTLIFLTLAVAQHDESE